MVTAAASTGMTAMSRNAVMSQVQTKSGICIQPMPGARKLKMVTMTLMAPMMEEIPMMWMANTNNAVLLPLYLVERGA